MPWHDDEMDRVWHDGDVSPFEWHVANGGIRKAIHALVLPTEGAVAFVALLVLDGAEESMYAEVPIAPSIVYDWPTTWRWAFVALLAPDGWYANEINGWGGRYTAEQRALRQQTRG